MREYRYLTCCVDIQRPDVPALNTMVNRAVPITLKTFRRHVDTAEWEQQMGYTRHGDHALPLSRDWHVAFYRSHFKGERCYFVVHSAIEYIFTRSAA